MPIPKLTSAGIAALIAVGALFAALAQQRPDGPGGPPGGFGGPGGTGGFGGPPFMQRERKLVKEFDKDKNGQLDAVERKAAREFLAQERAAGGGRGGGRFGPRMRGGGGEPASPGPKLAPADVKSYPDAAVYDPAVLRTFFLEFEGADWEKEMADFTNTDVEMPARLTVDGKAFKDVGVHFRGASSFGMVGEGRKRSLNISLDWVHKEQELGGYRTFNLLNSHEDPSFLRAVLYFDIARDYLPAAKANFVRLVINGESWGAYSSVQQFNKDFVRDAFKSTNGARWKVPGSPGGRGSLAYLGDNKSAYEGIYELKSKSDPKAWADLIRLCKVLNETPPAELEKALGPLLDIDGALKFLAIENTLINNDGYWIRTSDYALYQDERGQIHVLPHDANETFSTPGGPGFGGGPGGPRGFGPGMIVAIQALEQADANHDDKLSRAEFTGLADTWFDKLDATKTGNVDRDQFLSRTEALLPPPPGFGPPGGPGGPQGGPPGGGGFGPARFLGPGLFTAVDADKDGSLTRAEFKGVFAAWADKWDADKSGFLTEEKLREGFAAAIPAPDGGGGPGRDRGPRGGGGGGRGFGGPGMGGARGVELDPLIAADDPNKPLISKLLAVPALRTRYLGYVRDIAERWLDWEKLGPIAKKHHALIAETVRSDTRKLDSTEEFDQSLEGGDGGGGRSRMSLRACLKSESTD